MYPPEPSIAENTNNLAALNTFCYMGDDGIHVGFDRVHPRRHEHPGRVGALLVHVVDNLRVPGVVQFGDHGARFGLPPTPLPVSTVTKVNGTSATGGADACCRTGASSPR